MLKLTTRQQTFLDKLFELYREFKGPVHYSIVADKLGVNKFSAYDMLKVLEEKGVAASSYVLNNDQAGPGRSQVVFYPTNKAAQFLTQLRDEVRTNDWLKVKQRVLRRLEEAQQHNSTEALGEALSNLPDSKIPLNYCTEMISVLLLNIERFQINRLQPALESLSSVPGQVGLGTLAGLSLATTLASETEDSTLTEKLLTHTQRFQRYLSEMSDESVTKLSTFLNDARSSLHQTRAGEK
jgi:DNA-binding PadR family transcriptional regulator